MSDKDMAPEPKAPPREIRLEAADMLRLELMAEKRRRIEAEAGRLDLELAQLNRDNGAFVAALNQRLGVDLRAYTIRPDGSAVLNEAPPEK